MERTPSVARHYQDKFQFILVDEYQDTNHIQAEFIDILAAHHSERHGRGRRTRKPSTRGAARISKTSSISKRYPQAKVLQDRDQLPKRARGTGGRQCGHRRECAAVPQGAARREGRGPRQAGARAAGRCQPAERNSWPNASWNCATRGMDLNDMAVLYRAHYHSMGVADGAYAARHSLRDHQRAPVLRAGACQGCRFVFEFAVNPRDEVAFQADGPACCPASAPRSAEDLWGAVYPKLGEDHSERGRAPAFETFHQLLFEQKVPAKARKSWQHLSLRWMR